MAQTFDTQSYFRKLANNEALTEAEIVALLKAVDSYQAATAYLAECHAATAEGLPKATSKTERARQKTICLSAARLLEGDTSVIRHRSSLDGAKARCLAAADAIQ